MEQAKTEGVPGTGAKARLTGLGELFSRSWHLYKVRFPVFSLVYIFYLTPLMLISGFCFYVYRISPHPLNPFIMAWLVAGVIMGILVSVWGQAAFVYAVTDPAAGVKAVLHRATESVWKFFWLRLLFWVLTSAGFVLFMVPGLVMMVWFSFAVFILATRGDTGLSALLESREYVKGFWWPVFVRLVAIWALYIACSYPPVVGPLLSFLFMPYLVAYTSQLYAELVQMKGAVPRPTDGQRKKWGLMTAAGLVVTLYVVFLAATQVNFKQILSQSMKGITLPLQGQTVRPRPPAPPQKKTGTAPASPGIPQSI